MKYHLRDSGYDLLFGVIAALFLFQAGPVHAQSSDEINRLETEIQLLKEGQSKIQEDVSAIRKILESAINRRPQQQEFQPVDLTVEGSPFLGDAAAPLTIVEFTDYQCPFCKRHNAQTMPRLKKDYIETGKVRYVMREFPIEGIHPKAFRASEASLCAGDQGRYWEMHDRIFANQRQVDPEDLVGHAKALGLEMTTFQECFDSEKYADKVRGDMRDGSLAGVRGTPSFFFGASESDNPGKIKATKFLSGAQPYRIFKQAIDELLQSAS